MWIFDFVIPGTQLSMGDRNASRGLEDLIRELESSFLEANSALNLFYQAYDARTQTDETVDWASEWEKDRVRRQEIYSVLMQKAIGLQVNFDLGFQTEVVHKQEKWSQGRVSEELKRKEIFIYAKAFLYALDSFDKFLSVLIKAPGAPNHLAQVGDKMSAYFPHLRGVRNTAQHMEDRARGLGVRGAQLSLQPLDNDLIKAPNGALVLNSLNGSKYGCTMSDGHYGEVDVSPQSMDQLRAILIEVINCFEWNGPKQHRPS